MSSEMREVPEEAYTQARRALDKAAGAPVWGLYGAPLKAAVDAAARPIQDAVLRQFITLRKGCLLGVAAAVAVAVDLALYVGIALFVDGWLRWLAVVSFTANVAIQVFTLWWNRRARRIAQAELLADLKRAALL